MTNTPNLKSRAQRLRQLFFGELCAACGRPDTRGEGILCPKCSLELSRAMKELCMKCGSTLYGCYCAPPALTVAGCEYLIKLSSYEPHKNDAVMNRIVFRLKNEHDPLLIEMLARLLAEPIGRFISARKLDIADTLITYVPRCRARYRAAGVDQAKGLATGLSRVTGFRCLPLLERTRDGEMQKALGARERERNAEHLFRVKDTVTVSGKKIFLVDDIVTTGNTLADCCRALKTAGAAEVFTVCLARTAPPKRVSVT